MEAHLIVIYYYSLYYEVCLVEQKFGDALEIVALNGLFAGILYFVWSLVHTSIYLISTSCFIISL